MSVKHAGLLAAVIIPGVMLLTAEFGDRPEVCRMAAIATLVAILWITEAVPLAAAALLPLVLFPLFGIASTRATAAHYMNSTVFLLIGGFLIALAMQRWDLHRRIALAVLAFVGTRPVRLMVGFMLASAGLSMWISNTATTLVMLPIALAILSRFESGLETAQIHRFSVGLLLAIAYSASIGGMMTPVGTAPNLVFMRLYETTAVNHPDLGFAHWMMMTIPVGLVLLLVLGVYMAGFHFRRLPDSTEVAELVRLERARLGPVSYEEKVVSIVFAFTALAWVTRKGLEFGEFTIRGWQHYLDYGDLLDDGTVAILMAFVLFLIPARSGDGRGARILDEKVFSELPWPVVVLFGGGFALASGFVESGLSAYLASQLSGLERVSPTLMMGAVAGGMTFLTEMTSNTATTQLVLPILQSVSIAMNVPEIWLMLPATLSASCAFMLPVATPPNAIVFGSGRLRVMDMVRTGFFLNLAGIVVIVVILKIMIPLVGGSG